VKVKVRFLYSATYAALPRPAVLYFKFTIAGSGSWLARANGASSANCGHPTARVNVQLDRVMQLANTPPLQSTTASLHLVSIHQMAPLVRGSRHPITAYYSVYRPRKDERLSWPSWLTYRGQFTHTSGHPSAAGRAQDMESSPAKDRRHPLKSALSIRGSGHHLMQGFLDPQVSASKRHHYRFSSFCIAHSRAQQTYRQTHRQRVTSVASGLKLYNADNTTDLLGSRIAFTVNFKH